MSKELDISFLTQKKNASPVIQVIASSALAFSRESRIENAVQKLTYGSLPHLMPLVIATQIDNEINLNLSVGDLHKDRDWNRALSAGGPIFISSLDWGVDHIRAQLRQMDSEHRTRVVLGGRGISPIANTLIDEFPEVKIVVGETEKLVTDIIRSLGDPKGEIFTQSSFTDLNEPDARSRAEIRKHPYYQSMVKSIETSRGCTQACFFCDIDTARLRGIDPIKEEINGIEWSIGDYLVIVSDNLFNHPRGELLDLFRFINRKKIPWVGEGTIQQVIKNQELMETLSENCRGLLVGLEDPENEIPNAPAKQALLRNFEETLALTRQYKLPVTWSLICCLDNQAPEWFLRTAKLIIDQRLSVNTHIATPRLGTELHQLIRQEKRWLETDSRFRDSYHLVHQPSLMSWQEALGGYIWFLGKIFSTKAILARFKYANKIGVDVSKYALPLAGIETAIGKMKYRKLRKMYPALLSVVDQYENKWRANNY